jgi:hypothetical protein
MESYDEKMVSKLNLFEGKKDFKMVKLIRENV